jgi:hypothetical protein
MGRCTYLDPPKSPLRRGTLIRFLSPPECRGGAPRARSWLGGDQILCSLIKNWYNGGQEVRQRILLD